MDALNTIIEHVVGTLPDSISRRREVLTALHKLMKRDHVATRNIRAQLAALDEIQKLQAELPLNFSQK
jgi:short-subunit dehydrogenase